jgi:glycosyltransferase involved in cell wall biosynthesis
LTISAVIPVYRGELALPELIRRLTHALDAAGSPFEIIFVEDCGGDNSWEIIKQFASRDPRIRGLRMSRNYSQHNALLAGIRAARGDIVVTLDDDLQNPPEEIPRLLAKLAEGYDVVYGSPDQERQSLFRNWASKITKLALQSAMGAQTARKVSAFRIFRTNLRDSFASYCSPSVNIDVLLTWGTTRFTSVTVRHDARQLGESGYTLRKLVNHALNMMTGFSTLPLQVSSVMGIAFSVLGFLVLIFVVSRYFLFGTTVPGFTFLVSIISIFSGVQLFALGIIGEYLARMHFRSMERPPYTVRESTDAVIDISSYFPTSAVQKLPAASAGIPDIDHVQQNRA